MLEEGAKPPDRDLYENELLQYVYYHNWYLARSPTCPFDRLCSRDYDSQLFWFGIVSKDENTMSSKAALGAMRSSTLTTWVEKNKETLADSNSAWIYNFGLMPPQLQDTLGVLWDQNCPTNSRKYGRLGFSLLAERFT